MEELFQGDVEVLADAFHISAIDVFDSFVGVAESGADGLVNKHDVVVFGPGVIVSRYLVWLHVAGDESEGAEFEEVAELAGGAGAAVEPDEDGDVGELRLWSVLFAVEDELEDGVAFVDVEVASAYGAVVEVGFDV